LNTLIMPASGTSGKSTRRWYKQLWVQVLLAMGIGIALGHYYPATGQSMQPLGDAFIKLIRMLIAPIIFCTVILGIAKTNDMSSVGRIALKTLIYFEVLTTIALIIGLIIVNIWHPGRGMNIDPSTLGAGAVKTYVDQSHAHGIIPFLMNIIPGTAMGSLAEGDILQVLFVSVLFGCCLLVTGEAGRPVLTVIESASKILFSAVNAVMWATPLGAFGAIAFTVGKYGVASLWSLGSLILCFYVTCLVFVFLVFAPLSAFFGINFFKLLRYLREEILICFATTTSEVVLPRLLMKMEKLGCKPSVVGLVIPTGYSFNLDGTCLYLASTAVFLAQATNTRLDLYHQLGLLLVLLLTSKGAAGVAGAAFVVLAGTLSTTGTIPVASVALVLGIHRLLAEGMVPTNMIGNAVATLVISKSEGALDKDKLARVLNGQCE